MTFLVVLSMAASAAFGLVLSGQFGGHPSDPTV